jgi:hypothetical protein
MQTPRNCAIVSRRQSSCRRWHREETADEITRGANTDIEKARAIYDWIVDNTFRDPKTRGCGIGDIRFMLERRIWAASAPISTRSIVGLARAAGLAGARRLRYPRRKIGARI